MRYLVDTHLLVWSKTAPTRLKSRAKAVLVDPDNLLVFSVVSIWEAIIKSTRGRADFAVVPAMLRRALLDGDYEELGVTAAHVLSVGNLPPLHGDPFDRLLVAQARAEGIQLLTGDAGPEGYGEWVEVV